MAGSELVQRRPVGCQCCRNQRRPAIVCWRVRGERISWDAGERIPGKRERGTAGSTLVIGG